MAVNEQTGYQSQPFTAKQGDEALRDITGQTLTSREMSRLTQIFNIKPQGADQAPGFAVSAAPESVILPESAPGAGQERTEMSVRNAEAAPPQQKGQAARNDSAVQSQSGTPGGAAVKLQQELADGAQNARFTPEQPADPVSEKVADHDVLAFKALAMGAGAAGRVHAHLDKEGNRATHIGGREEDDRNDPNSRRNRMLDNFLYDEIYRINQRLGQIDLRLGELDNILAELEKEKGLLLDRKNQAQLEADRLQEQVQEQDKKVELLAQANAIKKDEIKKLEEEKQQLAQKIEEQNPGITAASASAKAAALSGLSPEQARIEIIDQELIEKRAELDLNQKKQQEVFEAREQTQRELQLKVDEIAELDKKIAENEARQKDALEEQASLSAEKEELLNKKVAAERQLTDLENKDLGHVNTLAGLTTSAATLQTDIIALEQELARLEQEKSQVKEQADLATEQHEKMQAEIRIAAEASLQADKAAAEVKEAALYDHINDRQVYVDEESGKLYWKDDKGARQDYDDGTISGALMEKSLQAALSVKSFMGNGKTGTDVEKAQETARTAEEQRISVARETVAAVTQMQEATQKVAEIEQKIAETKQQIAAGKNAENGTEQGPGNDPAWNTARSGMSASGSGIRTDSPLSGSFALAAEGAALSTPAPGPTLEAAARNNVVNPNLNKLALGGM